MEFHAFVPDHGTTYMLQLSGRDLCDMFASSPVLLEAAAASARLSALCYSLVLEAGSVWSVGSFEGGGEKGGPPSPTPVRLTVSDTLAVAAAIRLWQEQSQQGGEEASTGPHSSVSSLQPLPLPAETPPRMPLPSPSQAEGGAEAKAVVRPEAKAKAKLTAQAEVSAAAQAEVETKAAAEAVAEADAKAAAEAELKKIAVFNV